MKTIYFVIWVVTSTIVTPCPDNYVDKFTGAIVPSNCLAMHTKVERDTNFRMFYSEDKYNDFIIEGTMSEDVEILYSDYIEQKLNDYENSHDKGYIRMLGNDSVKTIPKSFYYQNYRDTLYIPNLRTPNLNPIYEGKGILMLPDPKSTKYNE